MRWAGSKRAHVRQLARAVPPSYGRYFEPFLGSGALFFYLQPRSATLGDQLEPLVNAYTAVRADPHRVHSEFAKWPVDRETFYAVRGLVAEDPQVRAAQFIYLNKTAWNGLYRVNQQGRFNVPYGLPKSSNIVPLAQLIEASEVLRSAEILHSDFEDTLTEAESGDLVFVDPPYVTSHNSNGFVQYNEKLFGWRDQVRLSQVCRDLRSRGVHVIATNAAHASIRELYEDFHVSEFRRFSTLAGRSSDRRIVSELVFSSGVPRDD